MRTAVMVESRTAAFATLALRSARSAIGHEWPPSSRKFSCGAFLTAVVGFGRIPFMRRAWDQAIPPRFFFAHPDGAEEQAPLEQRHKPVPAAAARPRTSIRRPAPRIEAPRQGRERAIRSCRPASGIGGAQIAELLQLSTIVEFSCRAACEGLSRPNRQKIAFPAVRGLSAGVCVRAATGGKCLF